MHWEASPFQVDDGQDVVKAKPAAAVVSEGWERVTKPSAAKGGKLWSFSLSSAEMSGEDLLIRDTQGSLTHWQKAFLLLLGGVLVVFIRRWLRSQKRGGGGGGGGGGGKGGRVESRRRGNRVRGSTRFRSRTSLSSFAVRRGFPARFRDDERACMNTLIF